MTELKCIYRSDRFTSVSSTTDYYYDEGDDDVFGNKRESPVVITSVIECGEED